MGKLEYVYLLHILFVAPFLIFSGYIGMNECSEEKKIVFLLTVVKTCYPSEINIIESIIIHFKYYLL